MSWNALAEAIVGSRAGRTALRVPSATRCFDTRGGTVGAFLGLRRVLTIRGRGWPTPHARQAYQADMNLPRWTPGKVIRPDK